MWKFLVLQTPWLKWANSTLTWATSHRVCKLIAEIGFGYFKGIESRQ